MGTNDLTIQLCQTVADAPKYDKPEYLYATLKKAVVVREGTKQGNDTVDLIFIDEKGQKYVTMITAKLLKQLAGITITERN